MGRFNKLLSTLQSDQEAKTETDDSNLPFQPIRKLVKRELIVRDPNQVRRYFDPERLESLAQTIATEGILEDLAVYELSERSGFYQLIFGERRFRASEIVGLAELPVKIYEKPEPRRLLKLQLIENKHHEDLNPIEEIEGVLGLLSAELEKPVESVIALLKQMDHDARRASNNVIGQPKGEAIIKTLEELNIKWRSLVLNQLPLLNLSPDILEPIRQGKIEYTKALIISRVKDERQRRELLQDAIASNLSVRDIRERIKQFNHYVSTPSEKDNYAKRIATIGRHLKTAKVLEDKHKRARLETLLKEIEELVQ